MPLADTPKTWPDNPGISTLHVLALFVGIPLLVILAVFLLFFAPTWGKSQRYRPGQPWSAANEWFGGSVAVEPGTGSAIAATAADGRSPRDANDRGPSDTGGASAGW